MECPSQICAMNYSIQESYGFLKLHLPCFDLQNCAMSLGRHFPGSKFTLVFFPTDAVEKGLTAVTESLIASLCPVITDKLMKSQFMVVARIHDKLFKVLDKLRYIITHNRMLPICTINMCMCHYKLH